MQHDSVCYLLELLKKKNLKITATNIFFLTQLDLKHLVMLQNDNVELRCGGWIGPRSGHSDTRRNSCCRKDRSDFPCISTALQNNTK